VTSLFRQPAVTTTAMVSAANFRCRFFMSGSSGHKDGTAGPNRTAPGNPAVWRPP
jgi:hypothetical protein